jgi:hypothetical protein
MMRALTLTQPWAGLVASGIKLVENRPRRMIKSSDFGTRFAIHASRQIDEDVYDRIAEIAPDILKRVKVPGVGEHWEIPCFRDWYRLSRDTSAVIAVATLDRIVTGNASRLDAEQRRWYFGPIGYVLRDVVALKSPVPCRGFQGFWTLPGDVEAKVLVQL